MAFPVDVFRVGVAVPDILDPIKAELVLSPSLTSNQSYDDSVLKAINLSDTLSFDGNRIVVWQYNLFP